MFPICHCVCLIAMWYNWCNVEILGPLVKEVGAGFVVGFLHMHVTLCVCDRSVA